MHAYREPVILHYASSVSGVGVERPPKKVLESGVGEVPGRALILHVLGHVAQEEHIRLLQGTDAENNQSQHNRSQRN